MYMRIFQRERNSGASRGRKGDQMLREGESIFLVFAGMAGSHMALL